MKELVAYGRGLALSVVVFGVVRVAFDPSAFRNVLTLIGAGLVSVAIQALALYLLGRLRRED